MRRLSNHRISKDKADGKLISEIDAELVKQLRFFCVFLENFFLSSYNKTNITIHHLLYFNLFHLYSLFPFANTYEI